MRLILILALLTLAACGSDGKDGVNGTNGKDGKDCADDSTVCDFSCDHNYLYIRCDGKPEIKVKASKCQLN